LPPPKESDENDCPLPDALGKAIQEQNAERQELEYGSCPSRDRATGPEAVASLDIGWNGGWFHAPRRNCKLQPTNAWFFFHLLDQMAEVVGCDEWGFFEGQAGSIEDLVTGHSPEAKDKRAHGDVPSAGMVPTILQQRSSAMFRSWYKNNGRIGVTRRERPAHGR
jgi:hypothetical protein